MKYTVRIAAYTRLEFVTEVEAASEQEALDIVDDMAKDGADFRPDENYWEEHLAEIVATRQETIS